MLDQIITQTSQAQNHPTIYMSWLNRGDIKGDVTLGHAMFCLKIHLIELGTGSSHSKVVMMWIVKYLRHLSNAIVSIN
jgi:hypothetical protein